MSRRHYTYFDKSDDELVALATSCIIFHQDIIRTCNVRNAITAKLKEHGNIIRNKPEYSPCLKKLHKREYSKLSKALNLVDQILIERR